MKVIHVIPNLRPGGAEKGLVNLLAGLKQCKMSNTAVYALYKGGDVEKELLDLGVRVNIIGFRKWFDLLGILRLGQALRTEKADILHLHLFDALLAGFLSNMISKVPSVIVTVHNNHEWTIQGKISTKVKLFFAKRFLEKVDAVIGVSGEIVETLNREIGKKQKSIWKIPCPVQVMTLGFYDNENFRSELGIDKETKVVTYVGRLIPIKNPGLLLNAFLRVQKEKQNTCLIFVGDGPLKEELENISRKKGLEKSVFFLGNRRDVPYILKNSDLYIVPSFSEGVSVALLEAMASRLPIVATKVGGNQELIKDFETGLFITPGDETGCFEAIVKVLESPDFGRKLGNAAYEYVKRNYSSERVSEKMLQIYRKINV